VSAGFNVLAGARSANALGDSVRTEEARTDACTGPCLALPIAGLTISAPTVLVFTVILTLPPYGKIAVAIPIVLLLLSNTVTVTVPGSIFPK